MYDYLMLPCIYKQLFGISCPLCGFQRSVLCLLQGDFLGSLKMFPPLFFLIIVSIITLIYYIRKKSLNSKLIKRMWITSFVLLLANVVYQNLLN
ncbi:MAG: DUF2752 domain-containing protein [Bacteroidales bacterium]|nr:DUF2752 domain-containing protein [Bacteroidales bacterium]